MSTFILLCQILCGTLFSWAAIRIENFYKDTRYLFLGIFLFFSLNMVFASTYNGHPMILVLSVAFSSFFWVVYFASFGSDRLHMFFYSLIIPSSGEIEKEYARGRTYEIQGKFAKAIDEYHKYYSEDQTDYVPLERIARCYLHLERPKEALTMLEKTYAVIRDMEKMKGDFKKQELARILYLQQEICRKYKQKEENVFRKILQKHYQDTRYAQPEDAFLQSYLDAWQDVRG